MTINVKNTKVYNNEMEKSAYDKLYFVDKIFDDIDFIVDFGCANGAVTRQMKLYYPNTYILGYDLKNVIENIDNNDNDITYTYNIEDISKEFKKKNSNGKSLLVMNSVYHELFNYMPSISLTSNPIDGYTGLLDYLFTIGFDYIFIRDINICPPRYTPSTFAENNGFNARIFKNLDERIRSNEEYSDRFNDFLDYYCKSKNRKLDIYSQEDQLQYIHFLLKCRYKENWIKELPEDYLKSSDRFPKFDSFLSTYKRYPYHKITGQKYVLPYVNYINIKDFDINIESMGFTTHSRCLFKRNATTI